MKALSSVSTLLFVLACASALQAGTASTLAAPCAGQEGLVTLQDYLDLDGDCSIGILNFSNFTFSATPTGGATVLSASQIDVTPVANGDLGGGFSFDAASPAAFAVGAGQTAAYDIDWFFVIDSGPIVMGANLDMDPPFGSVSITQAYCDTSPNASSGCQALTVSSPPCTDPVTTTACSTSRSFTPPIAVSAEVETTIILAGGAVTGAGFDSLTGSATVTPGTTSPEPASTALLLGGLMLVGYLGRHRAV